jgi:hypothetical protein
MYMATRDRSKPVVIDLEDDDSVALIPWEYVLKKMDVVISQSLMPDLIAIRDDLDIIEKQVKQWADNLPT